MRQSVDDGECHRETERGKETSIQVRDHLLKIAMVSCSFFDSILGEVFLGLFANNENGRD